MNPALEVVGDLLDELGAKNRSGTMEEVREAFVKALAQLSTDEAGRARGGVSATGSGEPRQQVPRAGVGRSADASLSGRT